MSVIITSVVALVLMFALATLLPINMGALALAGAFLVGGLMAGLSPSVIFEAFPADLVVTLVGVTYLFAIAEKNGAVDRLVSAAVGLTGGHAAAVPWIMFVITGVLTGVGALGPAAVAIVAPVALRFATRYRISPLLLGLMVIHGAQAGGFSPISVYGVITNQIVTRSGLTSDPGYLFLASLSFNSATVLIVYCVMRLTGTHVLPADKPASLAANAAPPPREPGDAWPDDARGAPSGHQLLTFAGLAALAVGGLLLDFNVGLVAITVACFLAIFNARAQKGAIERISWSTVLLIAGVITYVGVLQKVGTIDAVANGISTVGIPLIAALLLCYLAGVVSAFASSTALLGAVIPLALPFLVEGQLGVIGVVAALCVSTTIVDTSPFSTNGALVVANAEEGRRAKLLRQLLIYSCIITAIGPGAAWLLFVVTGLV